MSRWRLKGRRFAFIQTFFFMVKDPPQLPMEDLGVEHVSLFPRRPILPTIYFIIHIMLQQEVLSVFRVVGYWVVLVMTTTTRRRCCHTRQRRQRQLLLTTTTTTRITTICSCKQVI